MAEQTKSTLTLQEACDYLGITKQTMYKMTSKKEIPFHKLSKNILFNKDEIDQWVLGK